MREVNTLIYPEAPPSRAAQRAHPHTNSPRGEVGGGASSQRGGGQDGPNPMSPRWGDPETCLCGGDSRVTDSQELQKETGPAAGQRRPGARTKSLSQSTLG